MRTIRIIALVLLIIGAINWGLFGLFNIDLVAALFGARTLAAIVIYVLVGISGLVSIGLLVDLCDDK
jgi:hypothetical protein